MSDAEKSRKITPAVPGLYKRAVVDALIKLDPRTLIHNPVMFTVEIGSAITTLLYFQALTGTGEAPPGLSVPSLLGSGLRYSSQTLPRRLPKAGARRRQNPSGRCDRTQPQNDFVTGTGL